MSSRRNRISNKKKNKQEIHEIIEEENNTSIEEIRDNQDKELEHRECYSDKIFRISYQYTIYTCKLIYKTFKFTIQISGIYLLWICLHYIASHLYVKFCVPNTIIGFVMSPFMTATPHCLGLRWIVYNAANMINNMWIVFGTWICSTILIISNKTHDDTAS